VGQLIARERDRGIRVDRIVLGGFSQGGAVSLYMAPRFASKLAGVLALSCYLPCESSLAAERRPANDATPIFMAHGRGDAVLPMSLGVQSRDYLKALGFSIEWHDYPMAHAVCPQEVADIREFLARVLP
jgi:phospholipase/carboxylesterase